MSCMSQNFRLFHASNLSVRNFRIFLLMYTGSVIVNPASGAPSGRRAINVSRLLNKSGHRVRRCRAPQTRRQIRLDGQTLGVTSPVSATTSRAALGPGGAQVALWGPDYPLVRTRLVVISPNGGTERGTPRPPPPRFRPPVDSIRLAQARSLRRTPDLSRAPG